MGKGTLWLGLILLVVGVVLFFLSGATTNNGPVWALVYGTNQLLWIVLAVVGLIMAIIGGLKKS